MNKKILFLFLLLQAGILEAQRFSVYFDTDQSRLKNTETLDSAVQRARNHTGEILIECHCDDRANADYNYKLSLRRAESVQKYLSDKGVHAAVSIKGFGEDRSDYPNTPEERYKNRRCDVIIPEKPAKSDVKPDPVIPKELSGATVDDLKPGARLTINGLEFVGNQAVPMSYSMPKLYALLKLMLENSGLEILIRGHVCCGDDYPLSLARAKAVHDFLIDNGIHSNRLGFIGLSNSEPLVDEIDDATEQRNRRVEVEVITAPVAIEKVEDATPPMNVVLRSLPFGSNNRFTYEALGNLNLITAMVKRARSYRYVISVYDSDQGRLIQKQKALATYFKNRGIPEEKLRVIAGKNSFYIGQEILILEINPDKQK